MPENCEICGGPKKPMALSHSTGWCSHDANACLQVLSGRIAELQQRVEQLEQRPSGRKPRYG